MACVLDASMTLAWCFEDESTPASRALLERFFMEDAVVPALWSLEVGNILLGAQRKKRISTAKVTEFVYLLEALNIQVDTYMGHHGLYDIYSLAHTQQLTTYDAAYLELAMRLGLPLATKDVQLQKAAKRLGVVVY